LLMSQKALSLRWIERNVSNHALPTIMYRSIDSVREAISLHSPPVFPSFIRTCPRKARHGLIQSLRVDSIEEYLMGMRCLFLQMQHYGETQGAIAIQPFCESVANIVWAPGVMAIGPGNNGVTAGGKTPVITINAPAPAFYGQAIKDLAIPEAEIEMVVDRNMRVWVTQVRQAPGHFSVGPPPVNAIPGFLHKTPLNLTKSRVIMIRGLGDIDELCAYIPGPGEDVIVSQPNGSILSHAAAWCRLRGYSYTITDLSKHLAAFVGDCRDVWLHEPSRGWLLSRDMGATPEATGPIDNFRGSYFRGLEHALQTCNPEVLRSRWVAAIPFEMYATNQIVSRELAALAGVFTGTMVRTIVASCVDAVWRAFSPTSRTEFGTSAAVYGMDATNLTNDDVMSTLLAIFDRDGGGIQRLQTHADTPLRQWQWRHILGEAFSLMSAFGLRDRDKTVSIAMSLLSCMQAMRPMLEDVFGVDPLAEAEDLDPSNEWVATARMWATCLRMLQDMPGGFSDELVAW